jgi:hypothetical protein
MPDPDPNRKDAPDDPAQDSPAESDASDSEHSPPTPENADLAPDSRSEQPEGDAHEKPVDPTPKSESPPDRPVLDDDKSTEVDRLLDEAADLSGELLKEFGEEETTGEANSPPQPASATKTDEFFSLDDLESELDRVEDLISEMASETDYGIAEEVDEATARAAEANAAATQAAAAEAEPETEVGEYDDDLDEDDLDDEDLDDDDLEEDLDEASDAEVDQAAPTEALAAEAPPAQAEEGSTPAADVAVESSMDAAGKPEPEPQPHPLVIRLQAVGERLWLPVKERIWTPIIDYAWTPFRNALFAAAEAAVAALDKVDRIFTWISYDYRRILAWLAAAAFIAAVAINVYSWVS